MGGARAAFSCFFGPGLVHESPQPLVLSSLLHQVFGPFRRSAGADLVHKSQQNLVLSSPLHQVSGPFQRSAGTDLVHKSQQNLVLSSPLHQVSGTFRRSGRRGLGARAPAKPCSFVSFAPSLQAFSVLGPARTWCTDPTKPCSFVFFAPSLQAFSVLGRRGLGAQTPARPCSFVPFAPSLRTFSALSRQPGAKFAGCPLPAGTRWKVSGRRFESRKGEWPRPFSFSSFPQSKASGGTPEAFELLFLCSISIQSISIS